MQRPITWRESKLEDFIGLLLSKLGESPEYGKERLYKLEKTENSKIMWFTESIKQCLYGFAEITEPARVFTMSSVMAVS